MMEPRSRTILANRIELLFPMKGIPQKTLNLMRTDADEPLGAVDQLAEDNRNAMLLNAQAIMLSPQRVCQ